MPCWPLKSAVECEVFSSIQFAAASKETSPGFFSLKRTKSFFPLFPKSISGFTTRDFCFSHSKPCSSAFFLNSSPLLTSTDLKP